MRHVSHDATCGICKGNAGEGPSPSGMIFENELWSVRELGTNRGVPGWMIVQAQRHVPEPAFFDDREAASFGPTLRHLERVLEQVSGAVRIYTATMNESSPHFHCHMVPRYAQMPKDASAWTVFDLLRASAAGEISVDQAEAARITAAYRDALAHDPPPLA